MKKLIVLSATGLSLWLTGCGGSWDEPEYPRQRQLTQPVGVTQPRSSAELEAEAQAQAAATAPPTATGEPAPGTGQEFAIGAAPADEYADTDPSALTDFKPVLAPYGAWEDDATYGTVWYPSAS